MNQNAAVAAISIAALAACAGPRWTVAPPADAAVYIDGRLTSRTSMPMHYYGTTAVDALPSPSDAGLDAFATAPQRSLTTTAEPASPWLFPFDFPLECLSRLFGGTPPIPLAAALQPNPPHLPGSTPGDLDQIRARAFAARTSR